jgi:hypothetical protein
MNSEPSTSSRIRKNDLAIGKSLSRTTARETGRVMRASRAKQASAAVAWLAGEVNDRA